MSRQDCICAAKHRKDCVCAAAEAIVKGQQHPGTRAAFDRVFAMTEAELGRAAVEGARETRGPGRGRGGPFDPRGCF